MKTTKPTVKQLIKAVEADKDIMKHIKKLNYYDPAQFVQDVFTYIKAIKERRMLCVIKSVSASGMSRIIKFNSCEGKKGQFYYRQYICLFVALGYSEVKDKDAFRINGCGMDMIFHTNYSNIRVFKRLGFINEEECRTLEQMTPSIL